MESRVKENKMIKSLIVFLCILCTRINAATYFVSKNDINASDLNNGSINSPWKTLGKAQKIASPGDTVFVRSGTYNEMLKPVKSGTPEAKIAYKAYNGEPVTLDGQNSKSTGISFSTPASYIVIEGFEVKNFTSTGVYFQDWGVQSVKGIEISKCKIRDNGGDAISCRNSIDSLIENNEISNNGSTAVSIGGKLGSTNLVVRGNNIFHNGKDGVQGGGNGVIIEKNTIYDQFHTNQHQDGLDLSNISNVTIRYNTIYDTTQEVYIHNQEGPCSNIKVYGNIFYTNRYATVKGGQSPGVFVDSRFAGPGINGVEISSNTFGWTGYTGVRIFGVVDRIIIMNNIFFESGIALGTTGITNVTSNWNLFYRSVLPSMEGQNSIQGDPQFVNYSRHESWNFNLLPNSPAIIKDIGALDYCNKRD